MCSSCTEFDQEQAREQLLETIFVLGLISEIAYENAHLVLNGL